MKWTEKELKFIEDNREAIEEALDSKENFYYLGDLVQHHLGHSAWCKIIVSVLLVSEAEFIFAKDVLGRWRLQVWKGKEYFYTLQEQFTQNTQDLESFKKFLYSTWINNHCGPDIVDMVIERAERNPVREK